MREYVITTTRRLLESDSALRSLERKWLADSTPDNLVKYLVYHLRSRGDNLVITRNRGEYRIGAQYQGEHRIEVHRGNEDHYGEIHNRIYGNVVGPDGSSGVGGPIYQVSQLVRGVVNNFYGV
jgi:hypothetical protein